MARKKAVKRKAAKRKTTRKVSGVKKHKSVKAGRKASVKRIKAICPHCARIHDKSQHSSHGHGSFDRIHKT